MCRAGKPGMLRNTAILGTQLSAQVVKILIGTSTLLYFSCYYVKDTRAYFYFILLFKVSNTLKKCKVLQIVVIALIIRPITVSNISC